MCVTGWGVGVFIVCGGRGLGGWESSYVPRSVVFEQQTSGVGGVVHKMYAGEDMMGLCTFELRGTRRWTAVLYAGRIH